MFDATFWRMISSTGNSSPAQVELQIDDSGGPGGGNPLLIELAAIKDTPAAGWAGIDIQPSIGGSSKATKDLDSIFVEALSAHFGQTFRNYHGMKIQMSGVGASNEEVGLLVETQNSLLGANYCDVISRDPNTLAVRFSLGCGTTHSNTFAGPVATPELDVTGSGAGVMDATEGASCPTITAGHDILCALTGSGMQLSNNGAAYITIGAGGGGGAFSSLTGGTNTAAAMVLGTGSSLTVSGSGTNNATSIGGITVTGTPSVGYIPTATSGSAATWQAAFVW